MLPRVSSRAASSTARVLNIVKHCNDLDNARPVLKVGAQLVTVGMGVGGALVGWQESKNYSLPVRTLNTTVNAVGSMGLIASGFFVSDLLVAALGLTTVTGMVATLGCIYSTSYVVAKPLVTIKQAERANHVEQTDSSIQLKR